MPRVPKIDPDAIPVVVWGHLIFIINEMHLVYSCLRHPCHDVKLDSVFVKAFLFDIVSVFDAMDAVRDLGVDTTRVEILYENEINAWREMRHDAAHEIERLFRIPLRPEQSNDPSYASGRRVAAYDSRNGTLKTGSASVQLSSGLTLATDIYRFISRALLRPEDLNEMQRSVLWRTTS